MEIEVRKLNGALGAVIDGIKLEGIGDDDFDALHQALLEHQVVFLRDQHLTEEGHRALALRFGTPQVFPVAEHFGLTEYLGFIEDTADFPPSADDWHTDVSWYETPPKVAILCGLDIPAYGGDTMWADLYGCFNRLSPTMQEFVSGLEVLQTPGEATWDYIAGYFDVPAEEHTKLRNELREKFSGTVQPVVRTHPETGKKALFVSSFMEKIVGLNDDESRLLIDWLRKRVDNPNVQVRWSWRVGDVAIWDERCTNHRALADHFPQHRLMRRCVVGGDRPTYVSSS